MPRPRSGVIGSSVSKDRPTGENATSAAPTSAQACTSPNSGARVCSEYSDCTAATGTTAAARRRVDGAISENPTARVLPLAEGYEFGRRLAGENLGCVSGAGASGIMGEVVRGSVDAGGWAGGSNVPHIIELEGLPAGLSSFWLKPDIYTRMEVMIEHSDAFVIFPGGSGTVQEMIALMIFKHQNHPCTRGKPVVVFNRPTASGVGFWTPLIELLRVWCFDGEFAVVDDFEQLIPTVRTLMAASVVEENPVV